MRCCIIRQKHNDEQRREPEAELWQQKRLKWLASPGVFRSKQFQYINKLRRLLRTVPGGVLVWLLAFACLGAFSYM